MLEGKGQLGDSCSYKPHWVYSESADLDNTLLFFDNCPKYIKEVDKNKNVSQLEPQKFKKSNLTQIANQLSRDFGVYPIWNLTSDEVIEMYVACAFDVAVLNREDMWCSIFNYEQFKAFEYYQDLKEFWTQGYGYDINWKMSYKLLSEMIEIMDGILSYNPDFNGQRAKLRFAHAETVVPFVSLLGFFKDDYVWKADSPAHLIEERKWRSSKISPFAANVALVLYNCTDGPKVKVLHNEVELQIPGCDLYCPFEKFKSIYTQYLEQDFESLCEVNVCKGDNCQLKSVEVVPHTHTAKETLGEGLEYQEVSQEKPMTVWEMKKEKDWSTKKFHKRNQ
jgi:multiple inositol-polyphosphate phosphatase/2,3-bisphosphoglycerate 3-phosphatase